MSRHGGDSDFGPDTHEGGRSFPRRGLRVGAIGSGLDDRHYRLVTPIQRGGMGELFLAEMVRPGAPPQRVVIKRLLADLLNDDRYVKMFRSEAAVMGLLQHPNIVKLLDTPIIEHAQCLAMEFVYGRNLQQVVSRNGHLGRAIPVRIALTVMAQILRGLHHAHTFAGPDGHPLQLVHRDVTPGNVLVGFNGAIKLTDFGIAKSKMSLVSTTVGIVKGKARYLAPEQILGETATPRSDVFSAAIVTVELLTQEPLFERDSLPRTLHAIVQGERPDLTTYLPQARPSLVTALDRALSTDARRRPSSADAFAQLLLRALEDYGGPASGPEVGNYMQGIFHDRVPLPPLGGEADMPTIAGAPPATSVAAPVEAEVTDLHAKPIARASSSPTIEGDAEDLGPTHVLASNPMGDTLIGGIDEQGPVPSFDEAMSALALVQSTSSAEAYRDPSPPSPTPTPVLNEGHRPSLVFALGAAFGIALTVVAQSLWLLAAPSAQPTGVVSTPTAARLDVLYPHGADILLDGEPLEVRAPVRNVAVAPGRHQLQVSKGDYVRNWTFIARAGDTIQAHQQLLRYPFGTSIQRNDLSEPDARIPGSKSP